PWHRIIKTHLWENFLEIFHMHSRSVTLATTSADCAAVLGSRLLIELDTQLRRSLEDVKELAEGKIEQRSDHCNRVRDGNKVVKASSQPFLGNRQGQTSNRNREQQN